MPADTPLSPLPSPPTASAPGGVMPTLPSATAPGGVMPGQPSASTPGGVLPANPAAQTPGNVLPAYAGAGTPSSPMDGYPPLPSDGPTLTERVEALEAAGGGSAEAVLYTEQTLTEPEKTIARDNIAAAKKVAVVELSSMDLLPTDLRGDLESTLTIDGMTNEFFPLAELVLLRAPDYNGYYAYTSDGLAVEHEGNPSSTQDAVYVRVADGLLTLFAHGVVFTTAYFYTPDALFNATWDYESELLAGTYDPPTTITVPTAQLIAEEVGQIAVYGDAAPFRFFAALTTGLESTWQELIVRDGDYGTPASIDLTNALNVLAGALVGSVAVGNGGTGATTAKVAVTNLVTQIDTASTAFSLSAGTYSGTILRCTAATAVTITVPGDLGAGFNCLIIQGGAGQITFATSGGATINSFGALTKTAGQHASASLIRVAASTYNLSGNLA